MRKYKIHREESHPNYPYVSIGNKAWGVYHVYSSKSNAQKGMKKLYGYWPSMRGVTHFKVVKVEKGYALVQLPKEGYQKKDTK